MNNRKKPDNADRQEKKPSERGPGPGECEPVSMEPKPGGRRGPACPEGYPEEQPTDRPDAEQPPEPDRG